MRIAPRRTASALLAAVALAGCANAAPTGVGSGEQRFVAGDGTVTTYDAGSRSPVPAFFGTTLDGESFDLADSRGQVVVINAWAAWCVPCRAEAPALERVSRALRADGVRFVGLNIKDNPTAARAFLDRFGVTYPSVDASDGQAQLALRGVLPSAIPSTVVIDRQGRLAATVFGATDEPTLRRLVGPVLAEEA